MSSMYPSFGGAATRPCMRCGAPLAPNESQCSRCGMLHPLPQGQQPQGQQARSLGPSWGAQQPPAPQFSPSGSGAWPNNPGSSSVQGAMGAAGGWPQQQNSQPLGQNRFPSQTLPPNPMGQSGAGFPGQNQAFGQSGTGFLSQNQASQSQASLNNAFANYQQNQNAPNNFFAATQQQNYGSTQLGSMNGPVQRRYQDDDDENEGPKRPRAAMVTLIVILLVALVGGGVAFAGYKLFRPNASTVNSAVTPVAVSTPTGSPVFSDSFQAVSLNWDATPHTNTKLTISNGKMILEADAHSLLFPELLLGKTFADFRLDVDAALAKGDDMANGYGIYIRASSTQDNSLGLYYRFEIYGDGSFWIYKGTADANGNSVSTAIKQSPPNNAVYTNGTLNHLTIIAKGSQLSFMINGTTVSTFTDTSYKSGSIALFVSNVTDSKTTAQVTFEHFAIFPAQ